MYYSFPLKLSIGISQRSLYCYRHLKLMFLVRENFVVTTANVRPSVQTSGKLEGRLFGRDPFNQNFLKFRSKTQWIGSVQPEKFRNKTGPPLEGDHFSRYDGLEILVEWIAPFKGGEGS